MLNEPNIMVIGKVTIGNRDRDFQDANASLQRGNGIILDRANVRIASGCAETMTAIGF